MAAKKKMPIKSKESEPSPVLKGDQRIQTAEGWKRSLLKQKPSQSRHTKG